MTPAEAQDLEALRLKIRTTRQQFNQLLDALEAEVARLLPVTVSRRRMSYEEFRQRLHDGTMPEGKLSVNFKK